MDRYKVTLIGRMPLLMHADDVQWADQMEAWKSDPNNKKLSKAGDDRTPAWRWLGYTYHDGKRLVIPSDNLMVTFREGGALVNVGKGMKTFKAQTQSGAMVVEPSWPLLVGGKPVPFAPIKKLMEVNDFNEHQRVVQELGFVLSVKRAGMPTGKKHIRVRPRFDEWSVTGTLQVWDEMLTERVLRDVWTHAGVYKGLCDWRPGSKTPGQFGTFDVKLEKL